MARFPKADMILSYCGQVQKYALNKIVIQQGDVKSSYRNRKRAAGQHTASSLDHVVIQRLRNSKKLPSTEQ